MSIQLMGGVWPLGLRVSEKLVLLALADNANDEGYCWPLISTLVTKCSLSERAVQQAIADLTQAGHLTVHRRQGRSNYFRVHPAVNAPRSKCTPADPAPTPASDAPHPLQTLHPPPTFPAPITIIEPSSEPSRKRESRAPKRARSRTVPEDFQITEAMREWAKAKAPNVDIEIETEKFRDHEFRDPHSDWPAAWRQWIRRSPEFGVRARINGGKHPEDTGWRPPEARR